MVVCGFRDDHGIVSRLADYPCAKLPSVGANYWLPNICMNFLEAFLNFAKATVQEEDVLYRFWWEPSGNSTEVHVVKPRQQDISICLPQWYRDEIFSS